MAWHIERAEGTKIKDAEGNTVLWTQHTHLRGRRTDEEVMEIAHLASAAPDLASALAGYMKAAAVMLAAMEDGRNVHGALMGFQAATELANDALAKAEGRS